ncbi:hypothetical protein JXA47_02640 [Candidatus Sumerlaeota bacterium]|nr:hypothetical protein [Candidatus Sumerlaeota bacterium]
MIPADDSRAAIHRPANTCANCGAPLEAVPKHASRLVESSGGEEEVVRQDFCPACQAEARAGEFHSRWLAQRPAPPPPPKRETRRAQAAALREEFYRLSDQPEPSDDDLDTLFLLAHLLMKTGGFRWRETDEEEGILTFLDRHTQQLCQVKSVALDPERLSRAQDRLSHLL